MVVLLMIDILCQDLHEVLSVEGIVSEARVETEDVT